MDLNNIALTEGTAHTTQMYNLEQGRDQLWDGVNGLQYTAVVMYMHVK